MTNYQPPPHLEGKARRDWIADVAQKMALFKIGKARQNPRSFFSFVIREETTQARVKCLPHQEVVYKFVEHFDRCVIRMPVGFSKTYTMAALSMFLIGNDVTTRGAIISASAGQAQKPVAMCRDYIEHNPELRAVFPKLRPSPREGDPWTQSKITVDRPPGIRDPSLSAIGYKGKLPGSRLNWILVDDILTEENTNTEEQRKAVNKWFSSTVLSRRDIKGTKIVVTNTPWHPADLTYTLEKAGWPTLTMDIDGNIYFTNTCKEDLVEFAELPYEGEFDCDEIRPSHVDFPTDDETGELQPLEDTKDKAFRLTAHDIAKWDPDKEHLPEEKRQGEFVDKYDVVPLWPERYGQPQIGKLKHDYRSAMHEYNQLYRCVCRDDASARVKVSWVEACKDKARAADIYTFTSKWDPLRQGATFTGIDLGIGKKSKNDRTSIFTFSVLPTQERRLLRLDSGRWYGNEVLDLIQDHHNKYNSVMAVETNAAQDLLRQWALERNISLPIRAFYTGKNKLSKKHGVESIFLEIENGAWLLPNDHMARCSESTQRLIDAMLYYDPDKHTGDELMAMWIARELARMTGSLKVMRGNTKLDREATRMTASLGAR
jgi:hypothetical protein